MTSIEVLFSKVVQYVMSDQLNEVSDPSATRKVVVMQCVENNTAVYVYILAERVVLECETSINHW